jgi:putative ABC transport system permease protein
MILLIGLVAGMYPALVLSDFKPIQVLKGKLRVSDMGVFRKVLVVGQFVASIVLIIATLTVGRQLSYLRTKDLGFQKEQVVIVPTGLKIGEGRAFAKKFQAELEKNPNVLASTASTYALHNYGWMNLGFIDDNKVFRQFRFNAIDEDFVPAMGLKIVKGRNFRKNDPADSNYILVNEALVNVYGWKNPIGQKLPGKYDQTIIGVVKDFNIQTLYTAIEPAVMALRATDLFEKSSDMSYDAPPNPRISVRFKPGDMQSNIAFLKQTWKTVAGDREFDHIFLDETLAASYEQEKRLSTMVQYASFLSIFIACMGLFGLATLVVVRRTKEIGIRKVLGADVRGLVLLVSRDFVVLVAVASLLAFPLAWWALKKWLEDFAYRVSIPWWVFPASAGVALFIALITVSVQAVKAAVANPVHSLRTE